MSAGQRHPPAFVPTLTEVVEPGAFAIASPETDASSMDAEALVRAVMDRLDVQLERQVREAVARVVVAQTHALMPALREAVESAVVQCLQQAPASGAPASTSVAPRTQKTS